MRKESYDRRGFVYGNFQHPFFFEANYQRGKLDGRYLYHSFYYGFSTCEFYSAGKPIGTWRYSTIKGFEYVGDTSSKRQLVIFPFLNKDFYEGELNIWRESITLSSGVYNQHIDDKTDYKQIRLINCNSLSFENDIKKRFYSFDEQTALINTFKKKARRENALFANSSTALDDGSVFKGLVIGDFVTCHRNDLLKLIVRPPRSFNVSVFNFTLLRRNSVGVPRLFRGTQIQGKKTGLCEVVMQDDSSYVGFF